MSRARGGDHLWRKIDPRTSRPRSCMYDVTRPTPHPISTTRPHPESTVHRVGAFLQGWLVFAGANTPTRPKHANSLIARGEQDRREAAIDSVADPNRLTTGFGKTHRQPGTSPPGPNRKLCSRNCSPGRSQSDQGYKKPTCDYLLSGGTPTEFPACCSFDACVSSSSTTSVIRPSFVFVNNTYSTS